MRFTAISRNRPALRSSGISFGHNPSSAIGGGNYRRVSGIIQRLLLLPHMRGGRPYPQGCSTLFVVVHIAQGFEASERGGVAILCDGVGLIEPQDIVSEAR